MPIWQFETFINWSSVKKKFIVCSKFIIYTDFYMHIFVKNFLCFSYIRVMVSFPVKFWKKFSSSQSFIKQSSYFIVCIISQCFTAWDVYWSLFIDITKWCVLAKLAFEFVFCKILEKVFLMSVCFLNRFYILSSALAPHATLSFLNFYFCK